MRYKDRCKHSKPALTENSKPQKKTTSWSQCECEEGGALTGQFAVESKRFRLQDSQICI
jgi:hypothetical protein